jgi:hypothetical protein
MGAASGALHSPDNEVDHSAAVFSGRTRARIVDTRWSNSIGFTRCRSSPAASARTFARSHAAHAGHGQTDGRDRPLRSETEHPERRSLPSRATVPLPRIARVVPDRRAGHAHRRTNVRGVADTSAEPTPSGRPKVIQFRERWPVRAGRRGRVEGSQRGGEREASARDMAHEVVGETRPHSR